MDTASGLDFVVTAVAAAAPFERPDEGALPAVVEVDALVEVEVEVDECVGVEVAALERLTLRERLGLLAAAWTPPAAAAAVPAP